VRIRSLMLVTATVIALAVPGLASTAGAATMSGSSLSATRFVSSVSSQGAAVNEAVLLDGEKAVSVRVSCGSQECGFNGNVEWGTNYLKIWGVVWGTSSNEGIVLLTWHSGGVEYLREPGSAPGRAGVGVNKYYNTSEPSFIQVGVCGEPSGNCSQMPSLGRRSIAAVQGRWKRYDALRNQTPKKRLSETCLPGALTTMSASEPESAMTAKYRCWLPGSS
jgi:hypothetical protein